MKLKSLIFTKKRSLSFSHVSLALSGICSSFIVIDEGKIPIHGICCTNERYAFIIAGVSASGKSTLCAHLCNHGFGFIADDLCVIKRKAGDEKSWYCEYGMNILKLNPDSVKFLKIKSKKLFYKANKNYIQLNIDNQYMKPVKKYSY